ncbi:MAG: serine/threonine protein kinase [Gemmatimonadota bacterium]|nr:MAG: serine/threonine protein kinase [Gemmatimonadota bacterium]
MTDMLDQLTEALTGRYRIGRKLGQGGWAIVYLADDLKHDRKVAVKVLLPSLAGMLGPERFLNEIRVTGNLQHPHILPLYDSGKAGGFLYYVMPYVEGESLRDRIDNEMRLSVEETLSIIEQVAEALHYAHGRGVIHRDIKPENILIQDGAPMLADFGMALAVSTAGGKRLTQTGITVGTPDYMSPEQAHGATLDGRSDVYALGCVAYEMLAGRPPFSASTSRELMARQVGQPPPWLRNRRPDIPPRIARAIDKALSKVPADRFANPRDFANALKGEGDVARWEKTRPKLLRFAAAVALLVALVLVWWLALR